MKSEKPDDQRNPENRGFQQNSPQDEKPPLKKRQTTHKREEKDCRLRDFSRFFLQTLEKKYFFFKKIKKN